VNAEFIFPLFFRLLREVVGASSFIRDEEVEAKDELEITFSFLWFKVRSLLLYSGEPGAVVGREGGGVKGN